jgi:hypothetical protein
VQHTVNIFFAHDFADFPQLASSIGDSLGAVGEAVSNVTGEDLAVLAKLLSTEPRLDSSYFVSFTIGGG